MGYSRTVTSKEDEARFDFVIVGSGAGGGPLAANLAEAGFRVLLLEAGTDHQCSYYDLPIMQARASEDEEMCWDFFVRHYSSDEAQRRDSKFIDREDGVLYPRGATLGGSTAVSALVTVYPTTATGIGLLRLPAIPTGTPMRCAAASSGSSSGKGRTSTPRGRRCRATAPATASTAG
jgi:choline dehydrogenase